MNVKQLSAAGYAAAGATGSLKQAVAHPGETAKPKSMQVALSASSQTLYEGDNDVDMARVNAIRQALADGTLTINAERIADGLINSAKELL